MRILHLSKAFLLAWAPLFSLPVFAAQNAYVSVEVATVYASPATDAQEIDYLPRGTAVRISSEDRSGWYKVMVPGRTPIAFGWVSRDSVRPTTLNKELDAAGIQRYSAPGKVVNRNLFVLTAGGRALYFAPKVFQEHTGTPAGNLMGLGYSIEAGYRITTRWTVGARLVSQNFSQGEESDHYALAVGGVGAFVEYTYFHSLPFKAGLSLGGGLVSSSVTGAVNGNSFAASSVSSTVWIPAKLTAHWYPTDHLALVLAAGYQYLYKPSELRTPANEPFDVNASAPFAELGFQVEF